MSKEAVMSITATDNGTNRFSTSPLNMFDGENVNYLNFSFKG